MIAIGIVGDPKQPSSLVLRDAHASRRMGHGWLRHGAVEGRGARDVSLTGETFHRRFVWGDSHPVLVHQIRPSSWKFAPTPPSTPESFDTVHAYCEHNLTSPRPN